VFPHLLVAVISLRFERMPGDTYIADHAVVQRLVGGLVEFRPAGYADQIVLVDWGAGGGFACHCIE